VRILRDHEGTLGHGPRVVAIGVFDGLHRGHQALLRAAQTVADGAAVAVVTFDPHPASVLAPDRAPLLLGRLDQRLDELARRGVDAVRLVTFDAGLARESAESFVERVLVAECHATMVVVGEDFRFGHDRRGDVAMLRDLGARFGFEVAPLAVVGEGSRWSSTAVRSALAAGDLASANAVLGRPFTMRAEVEHGDQRGRELGYPTANLRLESYLATPVDGVYAGAARVNHQWVAAAISVGTRPQFYDDGARLIEVHLPGFTGDLYGVTLDVAFLEHLRPMAVFDDLEALTAQMARDTDHSQAIFNSFSPQAHQLLG